MRIGVLATRLAGTDGVSLEQEKIGRILESFGHEVFHCAGELSGAVPGRVIAGMHFDLPDVQEFTRRAFSGTEPDSELERSIVAYADQLATEIVSFLTDFRIEHVIVQNAFATPMHLPLAIAIHNAVESLGLPTLAHSHDYYWERTRFSSSRVPRILDTYFPSGSPLVKHASINSIARYQLEARRGLSSIVLPNIADFEVEPPGIDGYSADFRTSIGLGPEDLLVLQPTRVVPRKGIELSIELLAKLDLPRAKLVLTHEAGDEGMDYLRQLQDLAEVKGVELLYVADKVGSARSLAGDGSKIYSLWDTYPHADFVTYPSLVEGFGNALIEIMYFRKPALVNRYAVYQSDLAPTGLRFVEIDGVITEAAVQDVRDLLGDPDRAALEAEHNFQIGLQHFSYSRLAELLEPIFGRS